MENAKKCSVHNKIAQFYCMKCNKFACSECLFDQDKGHPFGFQHNLKKIEEIKSAYLSKLEPFINLIDQDISSLTEKVDNCEQKISEAKKNKDNEYQKYMIVASEIQKIYDDLIFKFQTFKDESKTKIKQLNEIKNFLSSYLKKTDNKKEEDVIQKMNQILELHRVLEKEIPLNYLTVFPYKSGINYTFPINIDSILNAKNDSVIQTLSFTINLISYELSIKKYLEKQLVFIGAFLRQIDNLNETKEFTITLRILNSTKGVSFEKTERDCFKNKKTEERFKKLLNVDAIILNNYSDSDNGNLNFEITLRHQYTKVPLEVEMDFIRRYMKNSLNMNQRERRILEALYNQNEDLIIDCLRKKKKIVLIEDPKNRTGFCFNKSIFSSPQINVGEIDLTKYKELKVIKEHKSSVRRICFITQNRFASCDFDGMINIWDMTNYGCLRSFGSENTNAMYISKYSDDSLIAGYSDSKIRIWNIDTGKKMYEIEKHSDEINKVHKISNERICSCSDDNTLVIFDSFPPFKEIYILAEHFGGVSSFIELRNKVYIVSSSCNASEIIVWSSRDYQCIKKLSGVGNTGNCEVLLELDNSNIVFGSESGVTILNSNTFLVEGQIKISQISMSWVSVIIELCKGIILCGTNKGEFAEIDIPNKKVLSVKKEAHGGWVNSLLIQGPNSFISCSNDKTIKIWGS